MCRVFCGTRGRNARTGFLPNRGIGASGTNAVYRNRTSHQKDYHIIHSEGKTVDIGSATRLNIVWYMDETQNPDESAAALENNPHDYFQEKVHLDTMVRKVHFDDLTGLPNMTYFVQLATEWKPKRIDGGGNPAMLFLDLSHMKLFNNRHGFAAGDELIRGLASLIRSIFGDDNACHISGDHFAVYADADGLEEKLEHLFRELSTINNGITLPLRVGIYQNSFEDVSVSTACDRAKIACDSVRGSFRSGYVYYDNAMKIQSDQNEYVLSHFDRALSEGWIQACFQPIVSSANGKAADEEALARWIDPELGILPPDQFIPVLEDAGLLYRLDLSMVDQIIAEMKKKRDAGIRIVPVSVNLSQRDFAACDMNSEIIRRLDCAGIDRKYLTIEITERSIGQDPELLKRAIDEFHTSGFSVWLDDFGSEYSSLNIVNNYQFELIKLDMKFL